MSGSAIFSRRLVLGIDSGILSTEGPNVLTVKVPAGAVSQDLQAFPLSVRVNVNPALVVTQTFAFVDSEGDALPFLLVGYDSWEGGIDIIAKVNLTAANDNTFSLLYS